MTPSGRGKKSAADAESTRASPDERTPGQRRRAKTWEQRLKRVFGIDVSNCVHCGGAVRIVASIEEPTAILAHFEKYGALDQAHYRPDRAGHRPWPWPRSNKIGHATNRENQQPSDAATIPQGRAWPDAGIQ